jgi:ATP-dependent Clp protease ATP-binding subunit ClpB
MTSNIGSNWILESTNYAEMKKRVTEALEAHFRPEFLNRVDETVIFRRLGADELQGIIDIQLRIVEKRLTDRKIGIELSKAARAFLAKQGYDPAYGARPLKRAVQQFILNPLSNRIISGEFTEGDKIMIDVSRRETEENLQFKKMDNKKSLENSTEGTVKP